MSAIIYRLTNTVNGKIYIGQTSVGIERRWRNHCCVARSGSSYHIHAAIRKYGPEVFVCEILEETTLDMLNEREIHWITELHPEYNMNKGGDGQRGWRPSEETRAKISAARKGQHAGENHPMYGKVGGMFGKKHSEETKAKMSAAAKGKSKPIGFGEKISKIKKGMHSGRDNPMYGKTHTNEAKAKMSEASKINKAGAGNPMWGKKHSEETKAKIRAAKAARRIKHLATQNDAHQSS